MNEQPRPAVLSHHRLLTEHFPPPRPIVHGILNRGEGGFLAGPPGAGKTWAALTEEMRARYLSLPGGTEATFKAALPQMLEDRRRRLMTEAGTADDAALRAHRDAFKI